MNTLSDEYHENFLNGLSAKARSGDPVQSHMAADRLNATIGLSKRRLVVLKHLKVFQPCTAKELDMHLVNIYKDDWLPVGIAHKRMSDLANLKLVRREKKDKDGNNLKEMLCYVTEAGEKFLRDR